MLQFALLLLPSASTSLHSTASCPMRIGAKQLFLDRSCLASLSGLEIALQRPLPAGDKPLLVPDQPWEVQYSFYNSVVDNGTNVALYYDVTIGGPGAPSGVVTALAVSEDGDTFVKPHLGQVILNGKDTNIVFPPAHGPSSILDNSSTGHTPGTVFRDERPGTPASEQWKMVALWNGNETGDVVTTHAMASADGIRWRHFAGPLYSHSDTQDVGMWSPLAGGGNGSYVMFRRQENEWLATTRVCDSCVVAMPAPNGSTGAAQAYCGVGTGAMGKPQNRHAVSDAKPLSS
jgi:hypothetical protein